MSEIGLTTERHFLFGNRVYEGDALCMQAHPSLAMPIERVALYGPSQSLWVGTVYP